MRWLCRLGCLQHGHLTSQQGLNEDAALAAQLQVEAAHDSARHAQHYPQVALLQSWVAGWVQQVLQLGDQQLAHPHKQRVLKGRYCPAGQQAGQSCSCAASHTTACEQARCIDALA